MRRTFMISFACCVLASGVAAQDKANFARNRFVTASAHAGDYKPAFVADGKIGPRNRMVTPGGGRHRVNIFFEEPVVIGSVHVYTVGYDGDPAADFDFQYRNDLGLLTPLSGVEVIGNTETAVEVMFPVPITTEMLRVDFDDDSVSVDEVAVFPPNGGQGYPLGTDVNLHQARQHRVALVTTSSTAVGTSRRSVVDGFVNDSTYWASAGVGPHTIELDVTDPPETNPISVRAVTTPVLVEGVHVYSGLSTGGFGLTSGRFQTYDDRSGLWLDIAGGDFSGVSDLAFEVVFDAPVEVEQMRLVMNDLTDVVIREIVPLPPRGGQGWPIGTSVLFAEEPSYLTYEDDFYSIETAGSAMVSNGDGSASIGTSTGGAAEQYQLLLNVSTNTYRIRNRETGMCLAADGASALSGAPVVETAYAGMPHQLWTLVDLAGEVQFINAHSGHALAPSSAFDGSPLIQELARTDRPLQRWTVTQRDHFPKKGNGGFPQLADTFENDWAYNWGQEDTFPAEVNYWPMQWGSFFWDSNPANVPLWKRSGEPLVKMGYNEPDAASQSDIPVDTAIMMWPRLEAHELPLLGPATVNPTNSWIVDFMVGVSGLEMRVDYMPVHWYAGPSADSFIGRLEDTHNLFGLDVVVSEFSVVDWSDTNGWTDDENFNFFAEVLWRMELIPWLQRYAVFVFTDEPGNPISDNRGELLFADGTLTPEGMLYSAWDGDTTIRTDTAYYIHNEGQFARFGVDVGQPAANSIVNGDRTSLGTDFQWYLEPGVAPGSVVVRSVADGRLFTVSPGGSFELQPDGDTVNTRHFALTEQEHGWFFIDETDGGQRVRMLPDLELTAPSATGVNARWRFAPVHQAPPGPPREVVAVAGGSLGEVDISWSEHGFRDLQSYAVYRCDTQGGVTLLSDQVIGTNFTDVVPSIGTYVYEVAAIGDTGESVVSAAEVVTVGTCPADFNGDLMLSNQDVLDAVAAIDAGLDYNGDNEANFFDMLEFLGVYDTGCP